MKQFCGIVFSLLLVTGRLNALAGGAPTDSLAPARFVGWSETTQLRLLAPDAQPEFVPAWQQLLSLPRLTLAVRTRLLFQLGRAYYKTQQPSLAVAHLLQSRQLALRLHDTITVCRAGYELCYGYKWLLQPQHGIRYGLDAVRLARHLRDSTALLTSAYFMLSICAAQVGDDEAALRYDRWQRPLIIARGHHANLVTYHLNQVLPNRRLHRFVTARLHLDSALHLLTPRDPAYLHAMTACLQGQVFSQEGRYPDAVRVLEPAAREACRIRDVNQEDLDLQALVPALAALGRYPDAYRYQRRLTELQATAFEASSNQRAQDLQALYDSERRLRQLAQQRQRIAALQSRTLRREAEISRRITLLVAALVALAGALGVAFSRWRTRQQVLRVRREEQLRNRIAADLHDEVGTLLTRVNLQAELLHQTQPTAGPSLDRLLTNARAAARTMRDIVWSIDAHADTVGSLLDRMTDHLDQIAGPAHLCTTLHAAGLTDTAALPPEIRQQVYLIFKEAVANAARHARHATQVTVSLTRQADALTLLIHDDGERFPSLTRSGLGLRSMHQRAASIGGHLTAGFGAGRGFRVELRVPVG